MNTGTCKDCKGWIRHTVHRLGRPLDRYTSFGTCTSLKFVDVSNLDSDDKWPPKDGVAYSDNESYEAWFETGEDFGCIHFEERE